RAPAAASPRRDRSVPACGPRFPRASAAASDLHITRAPALSPHGGRRAPEQQYAAGVQKGGRSRPRRRSGAADWLWPAADLLRFFLLYLLAALRLAILRATRR